MEYLGQHGRKYILSYQSLREDYERFCAMTDDEFRQAVGDALHFACVVGHLKEIGQSALADDGVIHQLVHLLVIPHEPLIDIREIRQQFAEILKLAR